MEEIQYELVDNVLSAEDFVQLKMAAGFIERPLPQVEKALKNGLFNVSAICGGQVVGGSHEIQRHALQNLHRHALQ